MQCRAVPREAHCVGWHCLGSAWMEEVYGSSGRMSSNQDLPLSVVHWVTRDLRGDMRSVVGHGAVWVLSGLASTVLSCGCLRGLGSSGKATDDVPSPLYQLRVSCGIPADSLRPGQCGGSGKRCWEARRQGSVGTPCLSSRKRLQQVSLRALCARWVNHYQQVWHCLCRSVLPASPQPPLTLSNHLETSGADDWRAL